MTSGDPYAALVLVLIVVGAKAVDRWRGDQEPESLAERARQAYISGEIDEAELERRLDLALDPEASRIREAVEPIGGVGPETSAAIALRFDSLATLQGASRDELEAVHGVGPSTSAAIRSYFDS